MCRRFFFKTAVVTTLFKKDFLSDDDLNTIVWYLALVLYQNWLNVFSQQLLEYIQIHGLDIPYQSAYKTGHLFRQFFFP